MVKPRPPSTQPYPASVGPYVPYDPRDLVPAPGLIWAYRFDSDGNAEPWPSDQMLDLAAGHSWIWAHFNLADARSRAWMASLDALPAAVRQMLITTDDHIQLYVESTCVAGVLADLVRGWDLALALHDLSINAKQEYLSGYGLQEAEVREMGPALKALI